MNNLQELFFRYGQSVWLDFISRDVLEAGQLKALLDMGVRGVTSNPSIFNKAISGSALYDDVIGEMARAGASAFEIYDAISRADITAAADEMVDSRWYKQVTNRANRLVGRMRNVNWGSPTVHLE